MHPRRAPAHPLLQRLLSQILKPQQYPSLRIPPLINGTLRSTALHYRRYTSAPTTDADADALRMVMRRVPHPVVILTTSSSASSSAASSSAATSTPSVWRGITLSSFNTLSLHPHALVSFNIRTPSSAASAIRANGGRFAIHVLGGTPRAATLAAAFAQLGAAPHAKTPPWPPTARVSTDDRGVPLLGAADGILARLRCDTETVVQVADHELWVGRVLRVERLDGWRDGDVPEGLDGVEGREGPLGLMYADRRFREVGSVVEATLPAENMDDGSEEEGRR